MLRLPEPRIGSGSRQYARVSFAAELPRPSRAPCFDARSSTRSLISPTRIPSTEAYIASGMVAVVSWGGAMCLE